MSHPSLELPPRQDPDQTGSCAVLAGIPAFPGNRVAPGSRRDLPARGHRADRPSPPGTTADRRALIARAPGSRRPPCTREQRQIRSRDRARGVPVLARSECGRLRGRPGRRLPAYCGPGQLSRLPTGTRAKIPRTPAAAANRHSTPFLTARGWRRAVRRYQAHLELDHLTGRVGHLLHGQAEPVPTKPDPLTAGPGDEFFGTPLLFGGVRVVHDRSVPFGRYRPGAGRCGAGWDRFGRSGQG
jgi:hypothetical protein